MVVMCGLSVVQTLSSVKCDHQLEPLQKLYAEVKMGSCEYVPPKNKVDDCKDFSVPFRLVPSV